MPIEVRTGRAAPRQRAGLALAAAAEGTTTLRVDRGAALSGYHVSVSSVRAATGTIVANRYLMGEELGRGGMGAVYRATDLRTGGTVAIKVLHADLARHPLYRERLRLPAQTAATLSSPRVVRMIDLDVAAESPFLVRMYVAGETLRARAAEKGACRRRTPSPSCW